MCACVVDQDEEDKKNTQCIIMFWLEESAKFESLKKHQEKFVSFHISSDLENLWVVVCANKEST